MPRLTVAQYCVIGGTYLVGRAIFQGFSADISYPLIVKDGMASSVFWLLSAGLPLFWKKAGEHRDIMEGFSAIAAGATGAAVMASVPNAWHHLATGI